MFAGTFSSLKIRNYRLYFIGQAISLSGTWIQVIAQDWLVLKLTNSGTQLGVVSALQFLPMLVLGPWGGVIVDRFSKRKLLIITNSLAGMLALILGLLVLSGSIEIWMLYIMAFVLGLVNLIDNPTRQTFIHEMVGKELLPNAVVLNSTEVNLARAIGPALAGVLITALGLGPCFVLNAVSYIPVLIMLFMIRQSELQITPAISKFKGQLIQGLRYVRSTPILLNTLLMMAIIGTFSYEYSVSLPLLAQFVFKGSAGSYSALVTATGIGSMTGGLFAARRRKASSKILVYSAMLFGVALFLAAWMPSLQLAVLFMFFAGIFAFNFISLGNTTLQLESAPEMRGRVMSLWSVAFLGSTPIGGPIIGWVGEYFGPRWALGIGGLAAILASFLGIFLILRKRKAEIIPEEVKMAAEEFESQDKTKI